MVSESVELPEDIARHQVPGTTWVNLQNLSIDTTFQRDVKESLVKRIARNFDWLAFRTLVVSKRADGALKVLDGQQRMTAAARRKIDKVPCMLFLGLTYEQEIRLFELLNDVASPTKNDIFKARLARGEPDAVAIVAAVTRSGFKFSTSNTTPAYMYSVVELEKIYKVGGPFAVERVCRVLHKAWGGQKGVNHASTTVAPLGRFLKAYHDIVDEERLILVMSQVSPSRFKSKILDLESAGGTYGGGSKGGQYGAQALFMMYNQGLKTKKLPWRQM